MTSADRYVGQFGWQHVLYRFFDHAGQLLYVGITTNIVQRWSEHRGTKRWWTDVADARVEFFPDRQSLADAERLAIRTECPLHNIVNNPRATSLNQEDPVPEIPAHPLMQSVGRPTCGALVVHPDGIVLAGNKLENVAISNVSTRLDPLANEVVVTFQITARASSVTLDADWLGERPEAPEPIAPTVAPVDF